MEIPFFNRPGDFFSERRVWKRDGLVDVPVT